MLLSALLCVTNALAELYCHTLAESCPGSGQEMAGTVGPPLPCTAFRLEAVPEMNYDPGTAPRCPSHLFTSTDQVLVCVPVGKQ